MSETALEKARRIAGAVTGQLGGDGIFGVELFVKGDEVWFSEVSPRPHDTGLVTLVSQSLSEFALHVRAILGLPIPLIRSWGPSASVAILAEGDSERIQYQAVDEALEEPDTEIRLFGKPEVRGKRRLGVALARGESVEHALEKARRAAGEVLIRL
jgi:phosphoribosylglycinamide formyltransferase 2